MSNSVDPYLRGLLARDETTIHHIYAEFAPRIEALVVDNGGTRQDARDVLQDALIVIWRKAGEPNFELTSSFYTYLHGVSRFIWLRKRKKKDNNTVTTEGLMGLESKDDIQQELESVARRRLFTYHFRRLGHNCQQLLRLFFAGRSMREIGDILSIPTEHAVRNRKYRCQKKLEDSILADPAYREHRNDQ